MEAMLGISLDSCLYLKLAKMLYLSYYLSCFVFTKLDTRAKEVLSGSKGSGERGGRHRGEMVQTIYMHMNKQ
jgi:hypothetical protein